MKDSKDEWHALNTLIALAGISNAMHDEAKTLDYLSRAKPIAERILSKEHLADIYTLYYKHYKRTGDHRSALYAHEQATNLKDSVLDMEKMNRIQNISLNIERNLSRLCPQSQHQPAVSCQGNRGHGLHSPLCKQADEQPALQRLQVYP